MGTPHISLRRKIKCVSLVPVVTTGQGLNKRIQTAGGFDPTVIQDGRRDRPSHGTMWITAEGAVVRTRLEVGDRLNGLTASVIVDYKREPKLDLLVPVTMREVYSDGGVVLNQVIECHAKYSNYRRFETAVRIVPE